MTYDPSKNYSLRITQANIISSDQAPDYKGPSATRFSNPTLRYELVHTPPQHDRNAAPFESREDMLAAFAASDSDGRSRMTFDENYRTEVKSRVINSSFAVPNENNQLVFASAEPVECNTPSGLEAHSKGSLRQVLL